MVGSGNAVVDLTGMALSSRSIEFWGQTLYMY